MTLTLRAMSLDEQPLTQPITAHFDLKGGTIGRADHNTMALPDPERFISRQQAEISAGAAGYFIKNVGSANPIAVRGAQLAQGESVPLKHGDQVRIGGYLLEVIDDAGHGYRGRQHHSRPCRGRRADCRTAPTSRDTEGVCGVGPACDCDAAPA